ncbi:hypothetical protein, partial [Desulforhopalus singaporensis]
MKNDKEAQSQNIDLSQPDQNEDRRKVLKTILTGTSAVAAYHLFPTNWKQPVIEQLFLPAHAATSGDITLNDPCAIEILEGDQTT